VFTGWYGYAQAPEVFSLLKLPSLLNLEADVTVLARLKSVDYTACHLLAVGQRV
jgi:hypothetical protein